MYARKLDPAPPHTVKLFNRMVAARVKAMAIMLEATA
jgi:hypothetical protein